MSFTETTVTSSGANKYWRGLLRGTERVFDLPPRAGFFASLIRTVRARLYDPRALSVIGVQKRLLESGRSYEVRATTAVVFLLGSS